MRTLKILVVDDDLSMRRILEIILETFGYDVFTASNGPEALEIYEGSLEIEMNIDLLITDRQMPGMLGEELIRRIKMLNSNIKAIL